MTMKNLFAITAVFFTSCVIAILIAGAISKSNNTMRAAYEAQVKSEMVRMTTVLNEASSEIEKLKKENDDLKTIATATKTTTKTPTKTTVPTKTSTKTTTTTQTKTTTTTPAKPAGTVLTSSLVASHASASDCWIIVSSKVYSVGSYISMHPGGRSSITNLCGKDATVGFTTRGGTGKHSSSAVSLLNQYLLGAIGSSISL